MTLDDEEAELLARAERAKATHASLAVQVMGAPDDGMSNLTVGGKRLTWHEAAGYWEKSARDAARLASILSDLDRCEHGRHEGDVCGGERGCNGPSHGNPLTHGPFRQIGYDLSGRPVVVPDRGSLQDPEAWFSV